MARAPLHQGEGLAYMDEAGLSPKALYLRELRRQRAAAEGRQEAWGLANLRLIPADENLRKGARREFLL